MRPQLIVVMGVSGVGKSTIGAALATTLGWVFQDADDLHPPANILRMRSGHALTDAERGPWLTALRDWVHDRLDHGQTGVLAASLLKRAYRDRVIGGDERVGLIYLSGPATLLRRRMANRHGHFMPPTLLDSQIETLEAPSDAERAVLVTVDGPPAPTAAAALAALAAR